MASLNFCPVPHLFRDRVWLYVGAAIGASAGYYYSQRRLTSGSSNGSAESIDSATHVESVDLDTVSEDAREEWIGNIDTFVFDCDGVLWKGGHMIPAADDAIACLKQLGKKVVFVTNNSTKALPEFKAKFDKYGIKVDTSELVSSANATADYLVSNGYKGKTIYVIGEPGLHSTVRSAGMQTLGLDDYGKSGEDLNGAVVSEMAKDNVAAVVIGFCNKFSFYMLTKAMVYIRQHGAEFICTNRDAQAPLLPDDPTLIPGNGAATAALATAVGREPINCGKPSATLANLILKSRHVDPKKSCMVGDRLDTDIAFGRSVGMQTLLVTSGVTDGKVASEMIAGRYSGPHQPSHVATSIAALCVRNCRKL